MSLNPSEVFLRIISCAFLKNASSYEQLEETFPCHSVKMNLGWLLEPFISEAIILVCLSVNKDGYNFIYLFLLLMLMAAFLGAKWFNECFHL